MKIQNDTTTDDIYMSYRCYIFNLTEGCYTKAAGIEPESIYEMFHATDWYIQKLCESHPMPPLRVQNRHHVVFSCSVEYIVSRLALPPEHKNKPTAYVFLPSADDIENQEFWECSEMTANCCFWQAFNLDVETKCLENIWHITPNNVDNILQKQSYAIGTLT